MKISETALRDAATGLAHEMGMLRAVAEYFIEGENQRQLAKTLEVRVGLFVRYLNALNKIQDQELDRISQLHPQEVVFGDWKNRSYTEMVWQRGHVLYNMLALVSTGHRGPNAISETGLSHQAMAENWRRVREQINRQLEGLDFALLVIRISKEIEQLGSPTSPEINPDSEADVLARILEVADSNTPRSIRMTSPTSAGISTSSRSSAS